MPVVSITRLRIRSWRYILPFVVYTLRARHQALRAEGNRGLGLMREPGNVFWTATVWDSETAVKHYMIASPHGRVMRHLLDWCDEAAVVRWSQDNTALPTWPEAHRRMLAEGRRSKVRYPSPAQEHFDYSPPGP